jgi:hypothetical protein
LIAYYLLQATAEELRLTKEDIKRIREVINNDDYYYIEHPIKTTSIIEIVCNNNKEYGLGYGGVVEWVECLIHKLLCKTVFSFSKTITRFYEKVFP